MPGSEKGTKRESSPSPQAKILQTIQETKKSLPIYPFKNDLIQAIKEHQVSHRDRLSETNLIAKLDG